MKFGFFHKKEKEETAPEPTSMKPISYSKPVAGNQQPAAKPAPIVLDSVPVPQKPEPIHPPKEPAIPKAPAAPVAEGTSEKAEKPAEQSAPAAEKKPETPVSSAEPEAVETAETPEPAVSAAEPEAPAPIVVQAPNVGEFQSVGIKSFQKAPEESKTIGVSEEHLVDGEVRKELDRKYFGIFLDECDAYLNNVSSADDEFYQKLKSCVEALKGDYEDYPAAELAAFWLAMREFLNEHNNNDLAIYRGSSLMAAARYYLSGDFENPEYGCNVPFTPTRDHVKDVFGLIANPLYYLSIGLHRVKRGNIPLFYTTPDKAIEAMRILPDKECGMAETNKVIVNTIGELKDIVKDSEYILIDFCKAYKSSEICDTINYIPMTFDF